MSPLLAAEIFPMSINIDCLLEEMLLYVTKLQKGLSAIVSHQTTNQLFPTKRFLNITRTRLICVFAK